MSDEHDPSGPAVPPEPPATPRHVRLYRGQWIGLPLIAVVPLLALFRVFDDHSGSQRAQVGQLHVRLEFPARMRASQEAVVTVEIRNTGSRALDTVKIRFDSSYLRRFTHVSFVPEATQSGTVALTPMMPGESRAVEVQLRAHRYWVNRGSVTFAASADTTRLEFATFVYP